MFVRFLGRFTAARDVASAPFWSRLAYRYIEVLEASGIPYRLASTSFVDFGPRSIWHRWSARFVGSGPPPEYVNVVCENAQAAGSLWTAGVPNVAIAAVEFEGQSLPWDAYNKYDLVCTPSPGAELALAQRGVAGGCRSLLDFAESPLAWLQLAAGIFDMHKEKP